jgi:hypothetical protein
MKQCTNAGLPEAKVIICSLLDLRPMPSSDYEEYCVLEMPCNPGQAHWSFRGTQLCHCLRVSSSRNQRGTVSRTFLMLNVEAECYSETLANLYWNTRHYIPEHTQYSSCLQLAC